MTFIQASVKFFAVIICSIFLLLSATGIAAANGDPEAGAKKAVRCAKCHGLDGISTNPVFPNHRGQKQGYFIKQLQDFKKGRRVDPIMSGVAAGLSQQDMEDLAAYYSSLSCK